MNTPLNPSASGSNDRPLELPSWTIDSLIGQLLDERYQIDELIGQGAMGAVYRARHVRLRRAVAVKVPKPEICNNREFLGRFEREALTMAKMVHENIVQIFDVYISPSAAKPCFIVMEFVEGAELEKFLRAQERDLTLLAVIELLRQVGRGLDAAHDRGIIHRDIKPSNIVVTLPQRIAKIMDFGIARIDTENVFATVDAAAIGTPAYMAPEQARGEKVTPAADIYALAVMVYRLLTRQLPYNADTAVGYMMAHMQAEPIPIHERNLRLPPALSGVLASALSKDPGQRPASALGLIESVAHVLRPVETRCYADLWTLEGPGAEG